MKAQAFPLAYLPSIDYVAHFMAASNPVIDQWEHWPKRTYRNRAEIASPKGRYRISVPVTKKEHHTPANEVLIAYRENWQLNHWRAIKSFYSNSPYFLFYEQEIHQHFMRKYKTIAELDIKLMETLLKLLGISKSIETSSEYLKSKNLDLDFRNYFNHSKDRVFVPKYIQVFEDRQPFLHNLSVIDLLFNLGPEAAGYLQQLAEKLRAYYSG